MSTFLSAVSLRIFSIVFWISRAEDLSLQFQNLFITFSIYPEGLYPKYVRVLLYTVLPAAYVSFVPISIVKDTSLSNIALQLFGTLAIICVGVFVFHCGLKKYESGNQWSAHGV